MRALALTEEQAKWLKGHLDTLANDRALEKPCNDDSDEHVESIRQKLERELAKDRW